MTGFYTAPSSTTYTLAGTGTFAPAASFNATVLANTDAKIFAGWSYGDTDGANTYGYLGFVYGQAAANWWGIATPALAPSAVSSPALAPGVAATGLSGYYLAWVTMSGNFAGLSSEISGTAMQFTQSQTVYLYGADGPTPGPAHNEGLVAQVNVSVLTSLFSLTTANVTHLESPTSSTDYAYTVTRSGDTSGAADLHYQVSAGGVLGVPAIADTADFVGGAFPGGTVHFNAGDSTATIHIAVAADSSVESDEGFSVVISGAPAGTGIGVLDANGEAITGAAGVSATGVIQNSNWSASIGTVGATSQFEGNQQVTAPFTQDQTTYTYSVSRSGYVGAAGDVSWNVTGAPASEFLATTGTVHFNAGADTAQFTVTVLGNNHVQPDYNFTVGIGTSTPGGHIGTASVGGTIKNDDAGFSIDNPSITENGAIQTITFTVTRSGYQPSDVQVNWNWANDGWVPVAPVDFPESVYLTNGYPNFALLDGTAVKNFGTLDFAAGQLTHTLSFEIQGNNWQQVLEHFHILLSNPSAGSEVIAGQGDGVASILPQTPLNGIGYAGTITGSGGSDTLTQPQQLNGYQYYGGPGNDSIDAYGYYNVVYAGQGNNTIYGGDGTGLVHTGDGNNIVHMHGYWDTVVAGTGTDSIYGTEGNASIDAGDGNDTIVAYGNSNFINHEAGNDSIAGGDHNNTIYSGMGADSISVTGWSNTIYVYHVAPKQAGVDYNDTIFGGDHDNTVYGGYGDNVVTFVGQRNVLYGQDGSDNVVAGSGYDSVYGGTGNDTVTLAGWGNYVDGGAGNDLVIEPGKRSDATFWYAGGAWHVKFGYNGGSDTIVNAETLRFAGGGADLDISAAALLTGVVMQGDQTGHSTINGLGGNDSVMASGHNNTLMGGDGNDAFAVGGAGGDSIDGGAGFDTVTFNFARQGAEIVANLDGSFSIHGPNGWDSLRNVERAVFTDGLSNLGRGDHGDLSGDRLGDGIAQDLAGNITIIENHYPGAFTVTPFATTTGWNLITTADLNGDGHADLIFQADGTIPAATDVYAWLMNGTSVVGTIDFGKPSDPNMQLRYAADLNGDGNADLILRDPTTGEVQAWMVNGGTATHVSFGALGAFWNLVGVGDFNGDGRSDLLFEGADHTIYMWEMNGATIAAQGAIGNVGPDWQVRGVGDFDGDGHADILWRNATNGTLYLWEMNGLNIKAQGTIMTPGLGTDVALVEDLTGDGHADMVLLDGSGNLTAYAMNGTAILGSLLLGPATPGWHLA